MLKFVVSEPTVLTDNILVVRIERLTLLCYERLFDRLLKVSTWPLLQVSSAIRISSMRARVRGTPCPSGWTM